MLDDLDYGQALTQPVHSTGPVTYTLSGEQVLWLAMLLVFALVIAVMALSAGEKPKG